MPHGLVLPTRLFQIATTRLLTLVHPPSELYVSGVNPPHSVPYHQPPVNTSQLPMAIAWEKIRIGYWSKQWNGEDQVLTSQLKLRGYQDRLKDEWLNQ